MNGDARIATGVDVCVYAAPDQTVHPKDAPYSGGNPVDRKACYHDTFSAVQLEVRYCVLCSQWRVTAVLASREPQSGSSLPRFDNLGQPLRLAHEDGPEELLALVNRLARVAWETEQDLWGV